MPDAPPRERAPGLRLVTGGAGAPASLASDDLLVRAFLAGDDRAFGELVRRHQRLVLSLTRRYARDADEAQDLAQRAFLNAFQASRRAGWLRGRQPFPFRAWLLRIAVNLGRNHVRDARRWPRAPALAAAELPVAAQGSESLERAERERAVRAAVLALPRRQREVLTLRIDAELPFREIAEALGITENNAKVTFHHATRRLRAAVATPGGTP